MKSFTFALGALAALFASAAFAQSAATIVSVEGLVTVATGDTLTNVGPSTVLVANSRVTVGNGGRIVLRFPGGCTATLNPGQSLQISETACVAFVGAPGSGNPVANFVSNNPVITSIAGLGLLVAAGNAGGGGGTAAPAATAVGGTPAPIPAAPAAVAVITPTPTPVPISNN